MEIRGESKDGYTENMKKIRKRNDRTLPRVSPVKRPHEKQIEENQVETPLTKSYVWIISL